MATMYRDNNDSWTIQFRVNKEKRTFRIGKIPKRDADEFFRKVKHLISSCLSGSALPNDVSAWIPTLPLTHRKRLVKVGLLDKSALVDDESEAPPEITLGEHLATYLAALKTEVKPGTITHLKHTERTLVEFFGADRTLASITQGDAKDWGRWLRTSEARNHRYGDKEAEEGLSENTARKRISNAKQFFQDAIDREYITKNPFAKLKSTVEENRERDYFLSREDSQKIIDACPDVEWRMIFALSRYGGLRCPSEHLAMRWDDIDWDRGRVRITSPKTAHHKGKGERWIPLFPELRKYLQEGWDAIDSGEFVITRYRDADQNLRTTFQKIIKRAGLTPWPKLFQNLRSSRATELAGEHPAHVAAAWLGHSTMVARKHYWQVTDSDFDRALSKAQSHMPNDPAHDRSEEGAESEEAYSFYCATPNASVCEENSTQPMGGEGLEQHTKNIEKTQIGDASAAKSAAAGPETDQNAPLDHFLSLAYRGRYAGASSGEKSALKLAKSIVTTVSSMDTTALAGAVEFLQLAKDHPQEAADLMK